MTNHPNWHKDCKMSKCINNNEVLSHREPLTEGGSYITKLINKSLVMVWSLGKYIGTYSASRFSWK